MGLNNEFATRSSSWLVFDVETVPMPDCADFLTDPIEAPSNYRDPDKIRAYINNKQAQQIEEAGLDFDLCEIVAISCGGKGYDVAVTRETVDERDLITNFWETVTRIQQEFGVLVGFNILNFDLPVLLRRSLYLDLPAPSLSIDRYRHDGIIDLAEVLSFGRRDWLHTLGFYCKRFGIPHNTTVRGADVAWLVANKQWQLVADHCLDDMRGARELAFRTHVIPRPEPVPDVVL
jgi:hypothetical protein